MNATQPSDPAVLAAGRAEAGRKWLAEVLAVEPPVRPEPTAVAEVPAPADEAILWRIDGETAAVDGTGGTNPDGSSGVVFFVVTGSRVAVPDAAAAFRALRGAAGQLVSVGSVVRVGEILVDRARFGEYTRVHDQRGAGEVVPAAEWNHPARPA